MRVRLSRSSTLLMGAIIVIAGLVFAGVASAQSPGALTPTATPASTPTPAPTARPAQPGPAGASPTGQLGPVRESTGWPALPGRRAPQPPPGVPTAVTRVEQVRITPELVERFLKDELEINRNYLTSIRSREGAVAAAQYDAPPFL